jgi:hypothetical protein
MSKKENALHSNLWELPTVDKEIIVVYATHNTITFIPKNDLIVIRVLNYKQAITDAWTSTNQHKKDVKSKLLECYKTPYSLGKAWVFIK